MLNFFNASSKKTYKEERADHKTLSAFPFSSELKHMTTISNVDGKIISYVKGSPEWAGREVAVGIYLLRNDSNLFNSYSVKNFSYRLVARAV